MVLVAALHALSGWPDKICAFFVDTSIDCAKRSLPTERVRQNSGNLTETLRYNHNHFLRMANGMRDRVLVKYVIFEKFRSDPEKDGSEVALAVDTSIHRDPVFGRLFSTFLRFFVKKRFALTRSIFGIL